MKAEYCVSFKIQHMHLLRDILLNLQLKLGFGKKMAENRI